MLHAVVQPSLLRCVVSGARRAFAPNSRLEVLRVDCQSKEFQALGTALCVGDDSLEVLKPAWNDVEEAAPAAAKR